MKLFLAGVLSLLIAPNALSQNFKSDLRKLNGQVEAAYKGHKLTANEYAKLKREHGTIQLAIDKAMADDIFTPDEKNKIHSKIVRARKRLAKYKTNREIY